jgi:hypothetical protein
MRCHGSSNGAYRLKGVRSLPRRQQQAIGGRRRAAAAAAPQSRQSIALAGAEAPCRDARRRAVTEQTVSQLPPRPHSSREQLQQRSARGADAKPPQAAVAAGEAEGVRVDRTKASPDPTVWEGDACRRPRRRGVRKGSCNGAKRWSGGGAGARCRQR